MAVWILKTEPADCSIDDIRDAPGGSMRWDGIRNYQARNNLRAMRVGDICLVYHSSTHDAGIAGSAELVREAYPDPAQFDVDSPLFDPSSKPDAPRWLAVDVRYAGCFAAPLHARQMKDESALAELALLKQGRLSVSPVTDDEWEALRVLLGKPTP